MTKQIAVIGAGTAGSEAARQLISLGYSVTLFEKENSIGGHVRQWHKLFPDRKNASEVVDALFMEPSDQLTVKYDTEITSVKKESANFLLTASDETIMSADVVLLATGFDLFDAYKKEEYGYGIYDNVITSADLEDLFNSGKSLSERFGHKPQRVGFVHCVGSRDEKAGNIYCSKVCCVTAVKQAMEVKELFPDAEVFCFYMDLRMFGRYYEEMYKEAQEKHHLQFIRGRLSEASENREGKVVIKVEDTLLGKPLKLTVDLLVLMTGMVSSQRTLQIRDSLGLAKVEDNFLKPTDSHLHSNNSEIPGVFYAGCCTGPKNISDTLADARSAVLAMHQYLKDREF